MALRKNKYGVYEIDLTIEGVRIRRSCKTTEKSKAQQLHNKLEAELFNVSKLGQKPKRNWLEAAARWLKEKGHKNSISSDIMHLEWLKPYLTPLFIDEIDRKVIDYIIEKRLEPKIKVSKNGEITSKQVAYSTVNRMLEVLRAILIKACNEWEWLDKIPSIRMLEEDNKRIRWITGEAANKLLSNLPDHLNKLAAFSLQTGLRKSNVLNLEWSQVDLFKRHLWIHPDQSKTKKAIPVPLNEVAFDIIKSQVNIHVRYVFTYKGNKINQCNTKAWRNALIKSGIEDFRWHDLRHTWASWHVQSGTSLQELQQLGGWSSFEMVLRYAHLSSDHLKQAADRISVKIKSKSENDNSKEVLEAL